MLGYSRYLLGFRFHNVNLIITLFTGAVGLGAVNIRSVRGFGQTKQKYFRKEHHHSFHCKITVQSSSYN